MEQVLVDKVAARILARLNGEAIDTSPRSVVVVFSGAASGFAAGREVVTRLARSPHRLTVMLTPSAKHIFGEHTIRDLGATSIVELEPWVDVSDHVRSADLVLVPTLTMNLVARLALGLMDAATTTLILGALLAGKRVLAARDGADPAGKRGDALGAIPEGSPVLWGLLEERLATIAGFGVELVGKDDFVFRMERLLIAPRGTAARVGTATPTAAIAPRGTIVTATEIRTAAPGSTLRLAAGQRLTPEAVDVAARLGLVLV
ncbi:MAG: hypothetical protein GX458_12275 [Phyllobacteriaceae bacterium]|nr:hypothetical protein [Phyllobacteriaceae bacterium]